MKRIWIAAIAALLAAATASTASAAAKAQFMKCATNKVGAFKDTLPRAAGTPIPLCVFTQGVSSIQLTMIGQQVGANSKTLNLTVTGALDPRNATLPKTYKNSTGATTLTGLFSSTKVKLVGSTPVFKTTNWAIASGNSGTKMTVKLTAFNKLTSQLSGKFSGKMKPGKGNPKAGILIIGGGTFLGDATFSF